MLVAVAVWLLNWVGSAADCVHAHASAAMLPDAAAAHTCRHPGCRPPSIPPPSRYGSQTFLSVLWREAIIARRQQLVLLCVCMHAAHICIRPSARRWRARAVSDTLQSLCGQWAEQSDGVSFRLPRWWKHITSSAALMFVSSLRTSADPAHIATSPAQKLRWKSVVALGFHNRQKVAVGTSVMF